MVEQVHGKRSGAVTVLDWLTTHRRSRRGLLIITGVLVGLLLLAFLLVGMDRLGGDQEPDQGRAPRSATATAAPTAPTPDTSMPADAGQHEAGDDRPATLVPLPRTDDPDEFATAVAAALFGLDSQRFTPTDYQELFAEALWPQIDPDARASITATISQRLPAPDMWEQMRSVQQRSEFDAEMVWEPRLGREGRENQRWPDGVVLRNVSGTQTETWHPPGQNTQTAARPVAVTVALACSPAASPCRLVGIQPNVAT
jgi:hypothetical protein